MKPAVAPLALMVMAAASSAFAEPLLVGVFAGTLPCADCPGVVAELTLVRKASGWAEGRYLLKRTYLGRPAAPQVTTGDWTTLRGDAADPDAVVYELDPDARSHWGEFLKRGEARLQALDPDLKALPPGLPQRLTRRTRGLPGPAAVDCLRHGGVPGPGRACRPGPSRR